MTAEFVYKRLLRAFPARFRREYGDGMLEARRVSVASASSSCGRP
ncbi:MAG TPA: hypothetical protein VFS23_24490 [Vicinamibacterales bacterium]|nr:hypothetical protein [Vicinamibacterales bacterium]